MLNKLGLSTFYGPCLLTDLAELDTEMLPYTKQYFEKFFLNEPAFEITSSPIWYYDRESYGPEEIGKPIDEKYYEEYKKVYQKLFADLKTPVLYNVNFGHAVPRCIIPYDAKTTVDFDNKMIIVNEPIFK